ncbi:MAG: hypothetical protein JWR83_2835 [Aeromicrobium sp.]|nr:hypothetical protein [Aeromicrobium sp.]
MSSVPRDFDLPAIAHEAEVEILVVETIEAAGVPIDADVFATAEFGYYEAELSSLRDAALALSEEEPAPG